MRHNRRFLPLVVVVSVALATPRPAMADALSEATGSYRMAPTSSVRFTIDRVGGGGMKARFASYQGSFSIDGYNVGRSTVSFTFFPKSVQADDRWVEEFLRSDAIFDVDNYPEITFRSNRIRKTGENRAQIDGTLTARGKSGKARFDAELIKRTASSVSFHVTGRIRRSPYGMGAGTPIYSNVVRFDMMLDGERR